MLVQPLLAFHNRDWLDRHQREERIDGVRIFREGGDSFVPRAGKRKAPLAAGPGVETGCPAPMGLPPRNSHSFWPHERRLHCGAVRPLRQDLRKASRKKKARRSGVSFSREAMLAPLAAGLAQVGFRPTPADLVTVEGSQSLQGGVGAHRPGLVCLEPSLLAGLTRGARTQF